MIARADRQPVSTYEQALWWLIQEWVDNLDVLQGQVDLPPEGRLVSEIFWVSHDTLRKDLRKCWTQTFCERVVSHPKSRFAGGR